MTPSSRYSSATLVSGWPMAGGEVLVELSGLDPVGEQRIALQVEDLAAIGLEDAQVAELHGGHLTPLIGSHMHQG